MSLILLKGEIKNRITKGIQASAKIIHRIYMYIKHITTSVHKKTGACAITSQSWTFMHRSCIGHASIMLPNITIHVPLHTEYTVYKEMININTLIYDISTTTNCYKFLDKFYLTMNNLFL